MKKRINSKSCFQCLIMAAFIAFIITTGPSAAYCKNASSSDHNGDTYSGYLKPTANDIPDTQSRTHNIGNIHMTITNYGMLGTKFHFVPVPPEYDQPSCQFPAYSDIEYLFAGGLWIGAVVDYDTLVSVGHDGWQWVNEMFPEAYPNGNIIVRSNIPMDSDYHPDARSEQDYIAVYYDTLNDPMIVPVDPDDDRNHIPLNAKITQKSYAWSQGYAEDFILFDFTIHNIGNLRWKRAYIGFLIDHDVMHRQTENGYNDDICGFKATVPAGYGNFRDTVNLAWSADNDGDPGLDRFNKYSPIAATGIRLLNSSNPHARIFFNWWIPQWGPSEDNQPYGAVPGSPPGDCFKYRRMSNGEIDYDQIYTAYQDQSWLPPSELAIDIANGADTRYLYSFGIGDLNPGDSTSFTIAYIAGDDFHDRPNDFRDNFDPYDPDRFYKVLDFTDLIGNSVWAGWIYDNPGVDTDGDGDFGKHRLVTDPVTGQIDTIYYAGDGVPDFKGPPPPPVPGLRLRTSPGVVTVRWNGLKTETSIDPFSREMDFEGYRIYMADKKQSNHFALVASCDLVDFRRYIWDEAKSKWRSNDRPLTLDSLKSLYGQNFDPLDYDSGSTYMDPQGNLCYFAKIDWNCPVGSDKTPIKKVFRDEIYPLGEVTSDIGLELYPQNYFEDDGEYYHKYYEYEYTFEDLSQSRAYYFAVTTFDYGYHQNDLEPLESSPIANAVKAYPLWPGDTVETKGLHASVHPNPYREDEAYARTAEGRRVTFVNLPGECVIKIWTLDGDLVRTIRHNSSGQFSESDAKAFWNLANEDYTLVVSGIYIYTIESAMDTQIGKIVLIK